MKINSVSKLNVLDKCPALFFFKEVVGFSEMTSYHQIKGTAGHEVVRFCHEDSTDDVPFKYTSIDEMQDEFISIWTKLIVHHEGTIFQESASEEKKHMDLGVKGIRNYWNRMSQRKDRPTEVEQFRFIRYKGMNFRLKFDQFRSIPVDDRPKWRPDLEGRTRYPSNVIIDLKFGQKPSSIISGKGQFVVRIDKKDLTPDHYRQAALYTLAHYELKNHLPLGFGFYFVVDDLVAFVHMDYEDFNKIERQVKRHEENVRQDLYPRNSGEHCKTCSFRIDCLGPNGELKECPLTELPAVKRGMPSWQIERGINLPVQSRLAI